MIEPLLFFSDENLFRQWLEKNHLTKKELHVGFYKKKSEKLSLSWSQAVDQALCFGWIDSVRHSLNEDSYCIRFTPRKKTSFWSDINIRKIDELTQKGLMLPQGLEAFSLRKEDRSRVYSFENTAMLLDAPSQKNFEAQHEAWTYFNNCAPSYKKATINWIMSAKKEETKLRRLEKVILASQTQTTLKR